MSILPVLEIIESVMKRAEHITENAANEHLQAFKLQMHEKLGVDEIVLDEPYLPSLLKEYEVHFLESLERLFDQIEQSEPQESGADSKLQELWAFEYKALRFNEPLLPQVEERLDIETVRYTRHLKQRLDGVRQQAAGIAKYIWRGVGDDRVRPTHAANAGRIFEWGVGEVPGEAFGCRCWAEPILEDAGEPSVQANPAAWAAAIAAAAAKITGILGRTSGKLARRRADDAVKPKPKPETQKPPEAPKPPIGKNPPPGGRDLKWRLGKGKSDAKWKNQMEKRGWTKEKIDGTIKHGKEYQAPNKLNPANGATRYEKDGQFVVRDNKTGEILQVSGKNFEPLFE